jgi:signal transduction histidine kinase
MTEVGPASGAPLDAGPSEPDGQTGRWWARSGLVARIGLSAAGVALGLAIVFGFLFFAIVSLRDRSVEARHSQQVISAANRLQTLVVDLETGVRGFALTRDELYLEPWRQAQRRYPQAIATLLDLTHGDRRQHARAISIKGAIESSFRTYSVPVVEFLRRNPQAAPDIATAEEGRREVETLRRHFDRFLATETALSEARRDQARGTTRDALWVGGVGLGGALLLVLLGMVYVNRSVARPMRLTADAAARIAGGDLSGRLRTDGPGEVGELERTFNAMAASLERTLADLEERNRTLVESERAKSELVSNVSHELRTPLASILGFSAVMLEREVTPEERRRYLEVIRAEARRLASLLNDLLDLQRVEQETLELRLGDVDLNELLNAQVTLFSAQSEHHKLYFQPADERPVVHGDRDRLAQVVGNLLSNAIKYSPEGGGVHCSAALIGDEAWVWIRDQGLGIPAGYQDQIFTKFFRGDVGRERGISGTGLGLVLARQIVEAHGGQIGFNSEEGGGSTFWFRVPAVSARPVDAEVPTRSLAAASDDVESRHRV